MIISETQYKRLPERLQKLFTKQPNPSRDEVVELFPDTKSSARPNCDGKNYGGNTQTLKMKQDTIFLGGFADSGSASRFFYCAKASKRERNKGCEGLEGEVRFASEKGSGQMMPTKLDKPHKIKGNAHPTVKPIALMEYLVKLVSREDAVVLDPFT